MSTDAIIKALQAFSTCDVSDALLKLKHSRGGFLSGIALWSPHRQEGDTKIVGPAYTIDSIPPSSILFISAPPVSNALYGGLMSNRAKYSGAAGTVVDGRIRDLQEHRLLNYPVFARNVGVTAPGEVLEVSEINTPVQFQSEGQDMVINPGDYLIGDLNGVVCLPKELAVKVLALMPSQVEADEKVAQDIQQGRTFAEAAKDHRSKVKKPEDV
ncbi:MAG: hypothetical protein Q9217_000956 [Psora testacea]